MSYHNKNKTVSVASFALLALMLFAVMGGGSYDLFFCKGKIADSIKNENHSCCVTISDKTQDNTRHNDWQQHDKKCCDQEIIKHDLINNDISTLSTTFIAAFDIPNTPWVTSPHSKIFVHHKIITPPRFELPPDDFVVLFQQFII